MGSGFNQRTAALAIVMTVAIIAGGACSVLSYQRPPARDSIFVSQPQHLDSYSPQQVHISIAGKDKMRISWLTEESPPDTAATVEYGTSPGNYTFSATGNTTSYKYMLYKSGDIHHAVIGPLSPSTIYYYRFPGGSAPSRQYNFTTPPSSFPIKFAIAGDLGQTGWTKSTLKHISKSNYDMLLLPGDLSYADMYQPRWDSYGRLVEPLASERPWMVTQGNHEVEKIPGIHPKPFTAYNARWLMPFKESGSHSNLYYSFDVAGVHVVMLGSYAKFERGSAQYKWLQSDLKKIDRTKTPWLFVFVHAPWYNSNTAHQGEKESVDMKDAMEDLLFKAKTDVVFSGHVHAYERFARVYKNKANKCGPMYITIGDGGNREGLATHYKKPQPEISMFREASFGHGRLEVVNGSHAKWEWHRNEDDQSVTADSVWIKSLSSSTSPHTSSLH
ncbi:unnamed protein product [Cuscuta campestris]|uniref:Purple acid phosphatase n=1 Tax=Cuscuta campestris TaxID=132261 RepID=A0A484K3A5_9ASTE|nr:unnamed protein product [Cuscuta campestris]